ncbi:LAQU0S08e02476g1_1 [Lachancea quebecensis]|uniref:GTPase-activating protein GYP5 n=1 Tax=Lachancea quebecensis TaxID=1654605 RepID=A0A0P1KST0_9SACH|nr:LAQU0S08e02476g1_1 [Lachancea quebecensis]
MTDTQSIETPSLKDVEASDISKEEFAVAEKRNTGDSDTILKSPAAEEATSDASQTEPDSDAKIVPVTSDSNDPITLVKSDSLEELQQKSSESADHAPQTLDTELQNNSDESSAHSELNFAAYEDEDAAEEYNTEVTNPSVVNAESSIGNEVQSNDLIHSSPEKPNASDLADEQGDQGNASPPLLPSENGTRPLPALPPRSMTTSSPPLPPRGPSAPPASTLKKSQVHPVPPPLTEELKSEKFRKNAALTHAQTSPPSLPPRSSHKRSASADFDLVISRFNDYEEEYLSKDGVTQESLQEGTRILKSSYTAVLETISAEKESSPDQEEHRELVKTDWPFWTRLVNNYAEVAKKDSVKLEQEITGGIPPQVRGIIWQLMANTKSKDIEEIYKALETCESPHEKAIQRDISRTNYIPDDKTGSLFNVLKAYSIYDDTVGYTQGMAFIATALILNVESEAEAFGLLTSIMKGYGLRDLFLPEMPGLHVKLYQFDRLLEENSPSLYYHLARQGVRSSMYASQWFLTCFAYRFPLCFVLRIFDIILVEGVDAILKFAVVLMVRKEKALLPLQFDQLLEFLKDGLFAYYLKDSVKARQQTKAAKNDSSSSVSLLSRTTIKKESSPEITDEDYDIDAFVEDAMKEVKITPITLKRYVAEYEEIHLLESQKEAQFEALRIKNKQLHKEVRKLEHDHTILNREHISIANELIENRLAMETLQDENRDLAAEVAQLRGQLKEEVRKRSLPNPDAELPTDLKADLQETMARNLQVMSENQDLQDKIAQLEQEVTLLRQSHSQKRDPAAGQRPANLGNWKGLRKVWK